MEKKGSRVGGKTGGVSFSGGEGGRRGGDGSNFFERVAIRSEKKNADLLEGVSDKKKREKKK